jgi:hypothetical protein
MNAAPSSQESPPILIATNFDSTLPINRQMPPELTHENLRSWTKEQRLLATKAQSPQSLSEFELLVRFSTHKFKDKPLIGFQAKAQLDGGYKLKDHYLKLSAKLAFEYVHL